MRLFKHILQLEEELRLRMLPDSARNPYDLKVLDEKEELEYFRQNAKYHKRPTLK